MSVAETKKLSFELSEEMLQMIAEEFNPEKTVQRYAEAVKNMDREVAAKEIFGEYGTKLGKRSIQLGNEYSDRTYEVMLAMVDHTGGAYKFPLVPQRFLEIAYLSILNRFTFPVIINSSQEFVFKINGCPIFASLKGVCENEHLEGIPCRLGCINLIKTAFSYFDLDVVIEASTDPISANECKFRVTKGL